jgi:hypothetical protein
MAVTLKDSRFCYVMLCGCLSPLMAVGLQKRKRQSYLSTNSQSALVFQLTYHIAPALRLLSQVPIGVWPLLSVCRVKLQKIDGSPITSTHKPPVISSFVWEGVGSTPEPCHCSVQTITCFEMVPL